MTELVVGWPLHDGVDSRAETASSWKHGDMSDPDRVRLRASFEEVPELYERARPVYPEELFDDLVALAELPVGGHVLEIGPGTGQATLPLARRGLDVLGLELGNGLASIARKQLKDYPKVRIVTADFESWNPHGELFDLVAAFTAFHWLDPQSRFTKAASLLRPNGSLAVISTQHVLPARGDPFWAEVQEDYDAVDPRDENRPPPSPDEVADLGTEIAATGLFRNVAARRYLWNVGYTADEYIAVLDTYSGHRSLEPSKRRELYERIHERIEARPVRSVTKTYLANLNVAQATR